MEGKKELIQQAAWLPRNPDRAVAFPLGASTFRALMVDRHDTVLDHFELAHPAGVYQDITHAIAGALIQFGCRPVAGAAFLAGMVPTRGLLKFTNVHGWPKFDRDDTEKLFGFTTEWVDDGTAGYYGLPRLGSRDFATLRRGRYQQGDRYIYAIFGTGLNVGCAASREDGQTLFVPRSNEDRELQLWFKKEFGEWPGWEDFTSGGTGFRNVTEFYLHKHKTPSSDRFRREFEEGPVMARGQVVTRYALDGHAVAAAATAKVLETLGSWLGAMAISHQARRIDVSPGILSDPELRKYALTKTQFLRAFEDQARPLFREFVRGCTLRVCLRNPEYDGAVERAAELLRAAG